MQLAVQRVQPVAVAGQDGVAADLHGRGHLAAVDRERFGRQHEAAHPLGRGHVAVDPVDGGADRLAEGLVLAQRGHVVRAVVVAGPVARIVEVRHQQPDQVRPAVAVNHGLAHLGLQGQPALDARRRHVLAGGVDDDVLLPARILASRITKNLKARVAVLTVLSVGKIIHMTSRSNLASFNIMGKKFAQLGCRG